MSFKNHDYKRLPRQEDILNCVTDVELFEFYLGGIPRKPISSPLREDKTPSFSVFHSDRYGKAMFKDFATGETGDVFVFLMKLFKYSNITDVFDRIAEDFMLDQFERKSTTNVRRTLKTYVSKSNSGKVKKDRMDIQITVRAWKIKDQKYWNHKYGFSKKQLEYCGVFPISHYFVNGYCKVAEELAYAFIEEKDGLQTFKIYQPFSKEQKWINNNDYSTWELWAQLPEVGSNLIITSSRKDAMVIKSLYYSSFITSCALQSEKVNPKDNVMAEIISRFDNVYVLYDNDQDTESNWGRMSGKKLAECYNLKQIEIPDFFKIKDISDFREKKGELKTKLLIKKLLTQI